MSDETSLTWGGETTSDERLWATISHALAFFFPIIGPIVVMVLKKDQSKYIAYHSTQAIVFQLITWFLGSVTCGIGLILLVLPIWLALKANKGEWAGYPLIDGVGRS